MKRLLSISLAVVLALGLSFVAFPAQPAMAQTTIYVPTTAYPTIQAGINAAFSGDTVQVTAGTYYENITLKGGVIVQGAGAGVTTIDGGGSGSVVTASFVDSTARLDGFTITGNSLHSIHNSDNSSPTITNNTITSIAGDGIYNYKSSPTITNNIITGNSSYGIHNRDNSSPTITNNTITGNSLHGIDNSYRSSPTITNNTITGNSLDGILNYYHSSPTITNNTITGNSRRGIYNWDSSSPTVTNSILWDNGQEIYNSNSTPVVTYSDIEGGYTGTGNIDADPLFVNPGAGDYHLQSTSPAIDTGDNAAAIAAGLTTDFEGDPRIWPLGGVVDMGADEYYVSLVLATIDIDPDTLNLKGKGKWITAYIELPEGYDVADIDAITVLRFNNDTVPAVTDPKYDFVTDPSEYITDNDGDGILERMVKFDRSAVQAILSVGDEVEITVTGEVGGTPFEGSDTIRVK